MKFKFRDKIKYIYNGHIINWLWRNKNKRRDIRNRAYSEMVLSYLSKYIPYIQSLYMESEGDEKNDKDEKIFSVWLQGEEQAPEIVKKCIESVRSKNMDTYTLLTEADIFNYVKLPDHIISKWRQKIIGPAHFVDIVRIELLYQYGGYWMDATNFMTGDIPKEIKDSDFFMFLATDEYFHIFIQNYFIRAKKRHPILRLWRDVLYEYWKNENEAADYFFAQYLFKLLVTHNAEAKSFFDEMIKRNSDTSQLLWTRLGDKPFDPSMYEEMKEKSFFQKCSYKKRKNYIYEILPESMADYVINGKI